MLSENQIKKIKKEFKKHKSGLPVYFSALGDPTRFKIFTILASTDTDICVTEFSEMLGVSVPAASQQLKILEKYGLVRRVRRGKMICYKIKKEESTVNYLKKIINKSLIFKKIKNIFLGVFIIGFLILYL